MRTKILLILLFLFLIDAEFTVIIYGGKRSSLAALICLLVTIAVIIFYVLKYWT